MNNKELEERITRLEQKLEQKASLSLLIGQQNIIPGAIKNRSMAEPNSYIYSGLSANKPTTGIKLTSTGLGCSVYFATDTNKLWIWNGSAWVGVTLS